MTRATIAPSMAQKAAKADTAYDAIEAAARGLHGMGCLADPGEVRRLLRKTGRKDWADDFRADLVLAEVADIIAEEGIVPRHAATFVLAVHAGAALTTFLMADLWGRGVL